MSWFRKHIFCTHPKFFLVSPNGYQDACIACMYYIGEENWFWKKLINQVRFRWEMK